MKKRAMAARRAFQSWPWLKNNQLVFSLRFGTVETERAYIRKKSENLTRTVSHLAVVLILSTAIPWLMTLQLQCTNPKVECTQAESEVTWIRNATIAATLTMAVGTTIFARLGGFQRCCGPESIEYSVVALLVTMLVVIPCTDWAYLAKILGLGDAQGFRGVRFTDTYVLLTIDSFITVSHLALPVRWIVLLASEVAALLVYGALAFGVGSSEPERALLYEFVLAGLIFGSAIGKRTIERHERALFLNTLEEKKLRARLEFKLSEKTSQTATTRSADHDASSVSATTVSGRVFDDIGSVSGDLASNLQNIAELGSKEHWLISTEEVELIPRRILGGGAFGIVVAGVLHGSAVAIKLSRGEGDKEFLKCFAQLANELRILRQARNPNVVLFHGACVDFVTGELALVEELVEGPSLESYVSGKGNRGKPPDDGARHCLVLGLCCGLEYLHAHKPRIVHGDLKPNNLRVEVLVDGPRVKLLDFGLSRLIKGSPKPLGGTLTWMAPEIVSSRDRDGAPPPMPHPAADVFSFGRLLFFIATGAKPLQGCEIPDIQAAALRGEVPPQLWPSDGTRFSRFCAPMAERCLSGDPAARPAIRDVHGEFCRLRLRPEGRPEEAGGEAHTAYDRTLIKHPPSERAHWQAGLRDIRESTLINGGYMLQDFSSWEEGAKASDEFCEAGSSAVGDDRSWP